MENSNTNRKSDYAQKSYFQWWTGKKIFKSFGMIHARILRLLGRITVSSNKILFILKQKIINWTQYH